MLLIRNSIAEIYSTTPSSSTIMSMTSTGHRSGARSMNKSPVTANKTITSREKFSAPKSLTPDSSGSCLVRLRHNRLDIMRFRNAAINSAVNPARPQSPLKNATSRNAVLRTISLSEVRLRRNGPNLIKNSGVANKAIQSRRVPVPSRISRPAPLVTRISRCILRPSGITRKLCSLASCQHTPCLQPLASY